MEVTEIHPFHTVNGNAGNQNSLLRDVFSLFTPNHQICYDLHVNRLACQPSELWSTLFIHSLVEDVSLSKYKFFETNGISKMVLYYVLKKSFPTYKLINIGAI